MRRCPITYEPCPEEVRYSDDGLRLLSRSLKTLHDFPYSSSEQRQEAAERANKMSIQGMQPKLSAVLSPKKQRFEVVDRQGLYIIKPQHHLFPSLPENEDLTMRMAAAAGIEIPLHFMIYSMDGTLSYVIRRFDRPTRKKKAAVEDFAQLSGRSRDTKYDSSMEQVAKIIQQHCTFPAVELVKLYRRTLFTFLTGNEDMHLKNFSLITRRGLIELSPAYDLLNTSIALRHATEELALPLAGKKRKLTRELLFQYYGRERLLLTESAATDIEGQLAATLEPLLNLISISFLSDSLKEKYQALLQRRWRRLGWT